MARVANQKWEPRYYWKCRKVDFRIGCVPPIVAAICGWWLGSHYGAHHADVVAYVSGVMGTLVGADLMNLRKIGGLGAPVASIGGAGTFDGIFLTGIVAVLLA